MNFASRFAPRSDFKVLLAVLSGVLGLMTGSGPALASDVWTGPLLYFTNYTPADVDMITPSVWITRGPMHGLYNVAGGAENHYTHYLSPVQTEWSYGELSDYASLTYNSWEGWFGGAQSGGPFTTVGRDAVLHIIPEDTYIGITFLS